MPLSTYVQGTFSFLHSAQIDALYTVYSSTQIKAFFDSQANELKTNHNGVISVLGQTTNGDSGADNIGMTPIAGVTGASTVQGQMVGLKTVVDNLVIGAVGDATTSSKGVVQLEDSILSTSITKAATPNSVKTVNDSLATTNTNLTNKTIGSIIYAYKNLGGGL